MAGGADDRDRDCRLGERLEGLYGGLADAGHPIGVRERAAVVRLLVHHMAVDPERLNVACLRGELAPVLAKSPEARDAYRRSFDEAFGSSFARALPERPGPDDRGKQPVTRSLLIPWVRTLIRPLAVAVLLAVATWWVWSISPWLVPIVPLGLTIWLIRRTAWKRGYLESRRPERPPVVHQLVSRAFECGAADSGRLSVAAQRLHRLVAGPNAADLAPEATVNATVAGAGRFRPVWARRRLEPEYLSLIAADGWSDVGADRMAALVDQLRRYGLSVDRYFIQIEHNLVYREPGEANIRLSDLVARHPDHRLVFMGAGTELFNPVSFEPWPWARDIAKWDVRTVLTPVRPEEWGRREIALSGLFASPPFSATTKGLAELADLLERAGMPEPDRFRPASHPELRSWRFRPDRWLEPIDEGDEEWAKLWQELRRHLEHQEVGIAGTSRARHPALIWLAACAVYPAVRWDLSVYLALGLTPEGQLRDPAIASRSLYDEATAVRLAELPWFRAGHMPDWLRLRLVRTLERRTRRDIVGLLERLLDDASDPNSEGFAGVSLTFADDRLPRAARHPLQDAVFLDEMARLRALALLAPRNLRERLGRLREGFSSAQTRKITFLQLVAMALRTGLRLRGQHGRMHGCVRATFEVLDNIPKKYKVGIFATPATYQAAIRFSSGPQAKDNIPGAQGMAIKLIGVPGRKILEPQADAVTHDFILLDFPVFFVRDTDSYARLVSELARLKPDQKPDKWLAWLSQSHPEDVAIAESYDARVVDSPLTQQYWSQVPYAFGLGDGTICRYSAIPHPENKNAGPPPTPIDGNYLRQVMIDHLTTAAQTATFDFCVQLQTDATTAVIDSPTVEWGTPYQRVALITIMAQDFAQPEQDRFGQNLSYTPWHALPEHRPVGQINETRRTVYAWSSRVRHLFSLTVEREPTSAVPLDR